MLSKAVLAGHVAPVPAPMQVVPPARATAERARLDEMFEAHHNVVWRTLRRCGLDADAATDAGQQTFLIAVERIRDIRSGSERAFLVGTALRLVQTIRRKAARVRLDDDMDRHPGRASRAEETSSAIELIDRVLTNVDPALVQVFVLYDVEGLSSPEIAEALDIPVGTVASRLRRAREEFRSSARRLEATLRREEGRREGPQQDGQQAGLQAGTQGRQEDLSGRAPRAERETR